MQVELSWEEIQNLIPKFGFEFRKIEFRKCNYTARENGMLSMEYNAVFFSAVKVKDFVPPGQQ